uniref:Uncharacterized protein n=1 Tax=Vitis vinifera TaxID=29760 RepID=A5B922_VITVI|nr:hypothetical protein VITISV_016286 [Vitis vinifera]
MAVTSSFQLRIVHHLKHWIFDFLSFKMILFASSPCISDLLMEKDFQALVLHVSELPIALPKIPHNSPQSRIALMMGNTIDLTSTFGSVLVADSSTSVSGSVLVVEDEDAKEAKVERKGVVCSRFGGL